MEELIEASHQYVNHPDPIEREAHIQRVLETNAQGIMEETAARIIVSATTQSPAQQLICFQPEGRIYRSTGQEISFSNGAERESASMVPSENVTLRSARPPRTKKNSGASRCLMGANLRKHNLTLMQRSPATRQQAEDNQLSTPANGSRLRHGRRPTDTSSQNNVPVDQESGGGGLALFWSQEVTVSILAQSHNYLDTLVTFKGLSATFSTSLLTRCLNKLTTTEQRCLNAEQANEVYILPFNFSGNGV
ncbi:hypothetical protein F2Q69_00061054 [Brassica cretica]|uniref:Uncharacterized protein n=1 Tax=Brassica cretica TaxID=69181 RepID=A0A8S9RRD0_BRACR|nr:hypothetical protein F2Q69_00061054 [Brassica cretica]